MHPMGFMHSHNWLWTFRTATGNPGNMWPTVEVFFAVGLLCSQPPVCISSAWDSDVPREYLVVVLPAADQKTPLLEVGTGRGIVVEHSMSVTRVAWNPHILCCPDLHAAVKQAKTSMDCRVKLWTTKSLALALHPLFRKGKAGNAGFRTLPCRSKLMVEQQLLLIWARGCFPETYVCSSSSGVCRKTRKMPMT